MSGRVIVVAGLGRCGSSLTMQMLAAAGLRSAGSHPDFEDQPALDGAIPAAWLERFAGGAVKVINPHLARLPEVPGVAIWLDRDRREQARSMMKFAALAIGLPTAGRAQVRRCEAGLPRERRQAIQALPASWPKLAVSYDRLIRTPRAEIGAIAVFLHRHGFGLIDQEAMFRQVRKRDPACAPDLAMEAALAGAQP